MGKLPPPPPPRNREEMIKQIAQIEKRYKWRVRLTIIIMFTVIMPLIWSLIYIIDKVLING